MTTCCKCFSSWIRIWSIHSLRKLPMNLSQTPFASGIRYGVFTSLILPATAEKCVAYFLSRSRIRYFGPLPHAVASRSCCTVHSSVGYFVTPVCCAGYLLHPLDFFGFLGRNFVRRFLLTVQSRLGLFYEYVLGSFR